MIAEIEKQDTLRDEPPRLAFAANTFNPEIRVAACMLFAPELLAEHLHRLTVGMFNDQRCRSVARCVLDDGMSDIDAIGERLVLESVDDRHSIAEWFCELDDWSRGCHTFNVRAAVDAIVERHQVDATTRLYEKLASEVGNGIMTPGEAATLVAEHARECTAAKSSWYSMADVEPDPACDRFDVITSGISAIDDRMPRGGFRLGDMVLVCGGTSSGKTAWTLQVVVAALMTNPELRCVWGMAEMCDVDLRTRALQVISGLSDGLLTKPTDSLSPLQRQSKVSALEQWGELSRRFIIVPPPVTAGAIEAATVATGAKLVVCDYLQMMTPSDKHDSRRDETDATSRAIVTMTKRLKVATILLSSVAKSVDVATVDAQSAPKESGEAAFSADTVLVMSPHVDVTQLNDANRVQSYPVTLRAVKQRHGHRLNIPMMFHPGSQRFEGCRS